MKNNLKRIAIILPVIALLLAFLAVPAAADYSPETGWDAPVGTFEPFEASVFVGTEEPALLPIGSPFEMDGVEVWFRYKLVFESWPETAGLDTVLIDTLFLVLIPGASSDLYFPCDHLRLIPREGFGHIFYYHFINSTSDVQVDLSVNPVFYLTEYPFGDTAVGEALQGYSFEVYEASSQSSPTEPIGNVWTGIMTWITSALTTVMGAFYVDGSLTLLGTLACIGVSVGIGFLLIGLIQRFLKLRG